jgi:hypothetical protein
MKNDDTLNTPDTNKNWLNNQFRSQIIAQDLISFSNYRSRLNFVPTLQNARFVKLSLPREKGRFDRAR